MPSVFNPSPTGFLPVQLLGGQVNAGSTRMLPISSGYAQNIGFGDLVSFGSGVLARVDTSTAAYASFAKAPVGVFLGCSYTDPNLKYWVNKQNWPTGTVAADAYGVICDDPDMIFQVTLTNASGVQYTSSAATRATALGKNIGYYQPATLVSTAGNSTVSGNWAAVATTAALPLRVVDVVPSSALSDGTFTQLLVTYNAAMHAYRTATGI